MRRRCCFPVLLCGMAFAQPSAQSPRFLNADIHSAAPGAREQAMGRFRPGARFEALGFTLLDLVEKAYGVADRDWIVGGPGWLGVDKFDIMAEVPADAKSDAMQPMLQALLADRFKLAVHKDRRPMPAYALVAGKRPQVKQSAGGEALCKKIGGWETASLECTNVGMEEFARELYDLAYGYFDRPLHEKMGLTGRYDLSVHWTPFNWYGEAKAISVFDALETQVGLKVETREETAEVLVIDHVERTPTPNAPGVTTALRSASLTQFEVAEVRAHKPEAPTKFATYETEADMLGLSLRNLIGEAYGARNDELQGGPKWVDTDRFDVIAKAPRKVPWENMQIMLQNLIEERFKLEYHKENRPIPAYALTVGKKTAKLANADPNGRSDCRKAVSPGGVTYLCRNTTMAQFADRLRDLTGDYPRLPVVDMTGLSGGFDFVVRFTPTPRLAAAGRGGDAAQGEGEASTPTGELTLEEAIEKQLGLKLQKQRLPSPVMVIDRVELPSEK